MKARAAVAAFGVLLSVPTALAQPEPAPDDAAVREPPETVLLDASDCARLTPDLASLSAILGIELGGDGVRRLEVRRRGTDAPAEVLASLRVECRATGELLLTIDDRATDKRVTRTLDLGDVGPESVPRVIALALAELLRASWAELAFSSDASARLPSSIRDALRARWAAAAPAPAPADGPDGTETTPGDEPTAVAEATSGEGQLPAAAPAILSSPPPPVAPASSRPRAGGEGTRLTRTWRVEGLLGLDYYAREATVAPELRAVVHLPIGVHVTVAAANGFADDQLGSVNIRHFAAGGGLSLLEARRTDMRFELDARFEVGWSVATGDPRDPSTAVGGVAESPYLALSAVGVTHGRVSERFALFLALKAGVAEGVRALSRQEARAVETAGMDGLFFGAGIGLSMLP